jgi:ribonuclease HI
MLWRHADEIAALFSGASVETPRLADQRLMKAARAGLSTKRPAQAAATGPVWIATDGSVRGSVTGYGWLASSGDHGLLGFRHSTKQVGTSVVLISELRAIGEAVRKMRGRDITLLSDSRVAIQMVKQWMAGDDVLPPGCTTKRDNGKTPGLVAAQRLIYAERDRVTPVWAKGHQGEPLNEGADALARLASRFTLGKSGLDHREYHRRAKELAQAFAVEFNRQQSA